LSKPSFRQAGTGTEPLAVSFNVSSRARFKGGFLLAVAFSLMLPGSTAWSQTKTAAVFPAKVLTDIEGKAVDVEKLAATHNLVVVTLKATWCPVCQRQLLRLKKILPMLKLCRVTFIVLAPGPAKELAKIKKRTGFDFPFVQDQGLVIARSLGIARNGNQILPCMLHVLPDLKIGWWQLGRNGAYFGDRELEDYFKCELAWNHALSGWMTLQFPI